MIFGLLKKWISFSGSWVGGATDVEPGMLAVRVR